MYQVKFFGPDSKEVVESQINRYMAETNLRIIDTKIHTTTNRVCTAHLILAKAYRKNERYFSILECSSKSNEINSFIAEFKNIKENQCHRIYDVDILPHQTAGMVYIKVTYTKWDQDNY